MLFELFIATELALKDHDLITVTFKSDARKYEWGESEC